MAIASSMVIVVLLALAITSGTVVVTFARSNDRVIKVREVVTRIGVLRDAVSDEAFAEASYRRAPNRRSWQELDDAMRAVPALIDDLRTYVDKADAITLSNLSVLNARYVTQIRSQRGRPQAAADDRVAGPALDAMRELLQSMIVRHRDFVTDATREQQGLITRLGVLLAAAFTLAFGILCWAVRLTLREHRRVQRQAASARARSLTDPLTGLANRAALAEAMESELGRPDTCASLLMIDLDHFKPVNDTYGHQVGDVVLRQVAERLRSSVRVEDVATRLGGDEFALFLKKDADADLVASRVLGAFDVPFLVGNLSIALGASIGLAHAVGRALGPDDLVGAADAALYGAKRSGRGRLVAQVDQALGVRTGERGA
ncbi:diguanylate cyclase [Nocardioides humilatus]|uniref:Diguanylate cyclase n=1 Tax=Nocardioides humilatus TaxID=2607660 RepID=A0A5B1L9R8_9ACTN|nr:diguanylate cyclase [Nocardioides humilatus]KAA1416417.1 diguanylate cyclase [Nocardioides humilatus]